MANRNLIMGSMSGVMNPLKLTVTDRGMALVCASLSSGIFLCDLQTPRGDTLSILYAVPLLLIALRWSWRIGLLASAGLIGLMGVDLAYSSGGVFSMAVFNKALLVILFGAIIMSVERHKRLVRLNGAAEEAAAAMRVRIAQLQHLSAWSLTLSGDPDHIFDEATRVLGRMFDVRVVCLSEIVGEELQFKSIYMNGQVMRNAGRCPLSITPCETVKTTKTLRVYDRVMERFPEAAFLRTHQAMAYCGTPSLDSRGEVVAVTCLLDDKPRDFTEEERELLRIFAQRIAMEIERARHEAASAKTDAALRASQERFDLAMRGANDGIWDWDIPTNENYWSDRWYELLEYERGELTPSYETWAALLHPDDRARALDRARRHLDERVPYDVEYRMRTKSGIYRWFHACGQALWDASGAPLRMAGSISDITVRKQAEALLTETEERWQYAFEGSGDGVWDWNVQTNQVYFSPRWKTMLGYEAHEIGNTVSEWEARVHPDDKPAVFEAIRKHFDGEPDGYVAEHRVLCKDGSYKWILDRGRVVSWDAEGKPLRMVGTHTDVTERRRMEEALRESHAELERRVAERTEKLAMAERQARQALNLLDATSDGVFIFDPNTLRFSYVNQGALNQLGYTRDALLAMTPVEIKPEFDHDRFRALLAPLMAGKVAVGHFDTVHRRIDGVDVPVEINLQYVHIQDSAPCFVAIVRDITERKRVEAMRQAHAVMERVMQERENLMRNLHDGVLQSLYALRLGLEQSRRLLASQPGKAEERLDAQIDDLALMIAEVRRFMVGQDPVWVQAGTFRGGLTALVDSYRRTAPVDWQVELPGRDEELAGLSPDEVRHLLYIAREAISNVVRHAAAARCRIALAMEDGCWELTIEDDGRGFDPAASRRKGLGVSNMEARARQIGAAIEMTSAPGTGTCIRITLARRAAHVSL